MENEIQLTPLQAREAEVAQYEANITMYQTILAGLPTEWPQGLLQHREATDRHKAAGEVADLDDVALLSQLWYADDCYKAIRSETVEKTKAEAILNTLKANG
jgi:N-acetyl-anhydromuramyl-L-alanine amidase AmpD